MNGLILIDKPAGMTSNKVTELVRTLIRVKKAAHAGTLDPDATGVLPIVFGKGIKLLQYMQEYDKEYLCEMCLHRAVDKQSFSKILTDFTGKIIQTPPEISAVAKKPRIRKIESITITKFSQDDASAEASLKIKCQHGTYIRTLVEDIGRVLGCETEMLSLRRTRAGPFEEKQCISLEKLEKSSALGEEGQFVLPLALAVPHFGSVTVRDSAVENISKGSPVYASGVLKYSGRIRESELVAVFDKNGRLIAVGVAAGGKNELEDLPAGIVIKTEKVLI
ncbi:MAG: RNA-guided pseudouridylation complex pseudouridine synthase subunit Cbf5 [Candidatus Micrarchaeota archaeon]